MKDDFLLPSGMNKTLIYVEMFATYEFEAEISFILAISASL